MPALHLVLLLLVVGGVVSPAVETPPPPSDLAILTDLKPGEMTKVKLPQSHLTVFVRLPAGLVRPAAAEAVKPCLSG